MPFSLSRGLSTATTQIPGQVTKSHTPPAEAKQGHQACRSRFDPERQCGKTLVGLRRPRFHLVSPSKDRFSSPGSAVPSVPEGGRSSEPPEPFCR